MKRGAFATVTCMRSHRSVCTMDLKRKHTGLRVSNSAETMDLLIHISRSMVSHIVQELCESRSGRPGLSVLTNLLVSVDVNNY